MAAAVEGADAAALTSAVTSHVGSSGSSLPFTGALPAPTGQLHPAVPPATRQPPPEAQVRRCRPPGSPSYVASRAPF